MPNVACDKTIAFVGRLVSDKGVDLLLHALDILKRDGLAPDLTIVGSGPAGLSAAGDPVRWGHAVTVFEALHEIGGVLIYGIPEFRLPDIIGSSSLRSRRG